MPSATEEEESEEDYDESEEGEEEFEEDDASVELTLPALWQAVASNSPADLYGCLPTSSADRRDAVNEQAHCNRVHRVIAPQTSFSGWIISGFSNEMLGSPDPGYRDFGGQGWSPLHLAAYIGQFEIASVLLSFGADASLQTEAGSTPAHVAALRRNMAVFSLLEALPGGHMQISDHQGAVPQQLLAVDSQDTSEDDGAQQLLEETAEDKEAAALQPVVTETHLKMVGQASALFRVGQPVDVQDEDGDWFEGGLVEIDDTDHTVLIHYPDYGSGSEDDEWVDSECGRFAVHLTQSPHGRFAKCKTVFTAVRKVQLNIIFFVWQQFMKERLFDSLVKAVKVRKLAGVALKALIHKRSNDKLWLASKCNFNHPNTKLSPCQVTAGAESCVRITFKPTHKSLKKLKKKSSSREALPGQVDPDDFVDPQHLPTLDPKQFQAALESKHKKGARAANGVTAPKCTVRIGDWCEATKTLEVHYSACIAGEYLLAVRYGTAHIVSSPDAVMVVCCAPCDKKTSVSGTGMETARCDEDARFTISAKDRYDNPLSQAVPISQFKAAPLGNGVPVVGACPFKVEMENSGCDVIVSPDVSSEGKFNATFLPHKAGVFWLHVQLPVAAVGAKPARLVDLPDFPIKVLVLPGKSGAGMDTQRPEDSYRRTSPTTGTAPEPPPAAAHSRSESNVLPVAVVQDIQKWTSRLTRLKDIAEQTEQPGERLNAEKKIAEVEQRLSELKKSATTRR